MNPLIGQILEHDGEFENTALLGADAATILKRLYKAHAISNLWMWCEAPAGVTAQPGLIDLTAALARELEVALTLVPDTLLDVATQTSGDGVDKLSAMLQCAWRMPPRGLHGVVFCFTESLLPATDSVGHASAAGELLTAFRAIQQDRLPFVVAFVGTEEAFRQLTSDTAADFFTKTVTC